MHHLGQVLVRVGITITGVGMGVTALRSLSSNDPDTEYIYDLIARSEALADLLAAHREYIRLFLEVHRGHPYESVSCSKHQESRKEDKPAPISSGESVLTFDFR